MEPKPRRLIADLFPQLRWYLCLGSVAVLYLLAFFFPLLLHFAELSLVIFLMLSLIDYSMLFLAGGRLNMLRKLPERMHLDEDTTVRVVLNNRYAFPISIVWIDEVPVQFQERHFRKKSTITTGKTSAATYTLHPLTRGIYHFGCMLGYVQGPLRLLSRRFIFEAAEAIPVYPSTVLLKQYQLLAWNNHTTLAGMKKIRRLGHSMEFEQIREYIAGDDVRTVNWKATARKGIPMVNNYTDTQSQQVYCLIDKGRAMKMPFEGMSLLDYAINAALMLLHVTLLKQDKAGLITFSSKIDELIPADRKRTQMHLLMETLYRQETDFQECNYEALAMQLSRKIAQRSFLLLFTNFETTNALERQLPYLRNIAKRHLLCVVFFENTALKSLRENQPETLEGVYVKTIADQFDFEKKQIVKELRRYGIMSILTTPRQLTVNVVNQYLEMKAREMI